MDRSAGSPRTQSIVGVRGPGVSVFGLPTKFRFFSKMAMEVNILTANFTILVNCAIQNYFSCQLSPKAQKESRHYS